jgi:hypothetical protein
MSPESTIGSNLWSVLDMVWPYCGWKPGRKHDIYGGRQLSILAELICRRCKRRWMSHVLDGQKMPWSGQVEAFFSRRLAEEREYMQWRRERHPHG